MDWLTSPWSVLAIFIVTTGLVTFAILRYRFKVSREHGLELSREKESRPQPLMPEKYAAMLVSAVNRAVFHQATLERVARETVEQQMSVFEEAIIAGLAIAKTSFNAVLASKKLSVEDARRETREYVHVIRQAATGELKSFIRKWFKNNHFNEKTDEEWQLYLALKKQTVLHIIHEILDRDWLSNVLSLTDLVEADDDHRLQLEKLIEQVFNTVRKISITKAEEASEEKLSYSQYIKDLTGIDPYGTK